MSARLSRPAPGCAAVGARVLAADRGEAQRLSPAEQEGTPSSIHLQEKREERGCQGEPAAPLSWGGARCHHRLSLWLTGCPSLCQVMEGTGVPETLQCSSRGWPATTDTFSQPLPIISGGPGGR